MKQGPYYRGNSWTWAITELGTWTSDTDMAECLNLTSLLVTDVGDEI